MKITAIEVLVLGDPPPPGPVDDTIAELPVVRVHTDEGLIGLGEATVAPRWSGETSRGCVAAIEELIGPALVGKDPGRITALRTLMDRELKLNPFTKAAVEMALWDLAGKAAGLPLYRLLGGKARDAVPIKMVVGAFDEERARQLAEQFLIWGVRCLKVKVGLDPDRDVERVRAVREVAGPKVGIGIDANGGWSLSAARQTLHRLGELNMLFAEQPIPPGDPAALAQLRQDIDIALMADESVFTPADAWLLAAHRAADILAVYPGKHGGIAAAAEIAHVAQAAGMVCALGSNLELGVGTAAMLHLAVALPGMASERYPADAIGPLYHQADLLTQPLELGPEVARVPEGPGLGVELDEDQLRRWRQT